MCCFDQVFYVLSCRELVDKMSHLAKFVSDKCPTQKLGESSLTVISSRRIPSLF